MATVLTRQPNYDVRDLHAQVMAALNEAEVAIGERFEIVRIPGSKKLTAPRPRARATDPETSKEAAKNVVPRAEAHSGIALIAIAKTGERGATAAEVEEETKVRGIWKRISELHDSGWIRSTGTRIVAATDSAAQVYVPTTAGWEWVEAHSRLTQPGTTERGLF